MPNPELFNPPFIETFQTALEQGTIELAKNMPDSAKKMQFLQEKHNVTIKHITASSYIMLTLIKDMINLPINSQFNLSKEISELRNFFSYFEGHEELLLRTFLKASLLHDIGKSEQTEQVAQTGNFTVQQKNYLTRHTIDGLEELSLEKDSDNPEVIALYQLYALMHHMYFLFPSSQSEQIAGISRFYPDYHSIALYLKTPKQKQPKWNDNNENLLAVFAHSNSATANVSAIEQNLHLISCFEKIIAPEDLKEFHNEYYNRPTYYSTLIKGLVNLMFFSDVAARSIYGYEHNLIRDPESFLSYLNNGPDGQIQYPESFGYYGSIIYELLQKHNKDKFKQKPETRFLESLKAEAQQLNIF